MNAKHPLKINEYCRSAYLPLSHDATSKEIEKFSWKNKVDDNEIYCLNESLKF